MTALIAVEGFAIFKHLRLQGLLSAADWFRALTMVLALFGIMAVYTSHTRKKNAPTKDAAHIASRAPRSISDSLSFVRYLGNRRPLLTRLLILAFFAIPVGLYAMTKPHGWNDFTVRDWITIAIAELPFFIIAIFLAVATWTDRDRKNRGE
ncbi:MAG TPA: hypothetical protein VGJ20_24025 [Xanthobacteraceae bacterium]|jgi:hypothetical protein